MRKETPASHTQIHEVIDNISFTYIAPSTVHGRGLFARQPIAQGTILGTLDGQVMSWDQYHRLRATAPCDIPEMFFEWNALAPDTLLVRPFRTKYSFINHSRTPNVALARFPLRVVALRGIAQDEELLLDYRKEPLNDEYLNGHGKTYL